MKTLKFTEQLLQEQLAQKNITSYAILIGCGQDEWCFTSPDVNLDSYFDAASIGKVYPTCTLALQAIDKGLLSLDDTLEKFFPNVPTDKKLITVKQLMTHSSGMLRKEFDDHTADRGRDSITDFIFKEPLAYEPGTKYAYCCTGMVLLGFIIEKIYQMGLDEAFQKYLCEPLGLTRSKYRLAADEPNAVNCNHNPSIHDIRWDDNNVRMMKGIPAGAGGLFISPGDLLTFVKALLAKDARLYSEATFGLAEQNYTKNLPVLDEFRGSDNHGLGYVYVNNACYQACELFPEGSIGHTGWTGQSFYLNRDKQLYVILMTNATRCNAIKHGVEHLNYDEVCRMRVAFHHAIKKDLNL